MRLPIKILYPSEIGPEMTPVVKARFKIIAWIKELEEPDPN